ncbi:MAG TPA: aminotransferase class V-fold PLP-dependent enzyme [Patescibacteria group bacterium]|nr:aminotransferase class V-fold PLP-dependent enzyme [Patescibacteria group bacterium]
MDFRSYISGQDVRVPTITGERAYCSLDNAASTPPLVAVMEAVDQFMPWYSSVHRGSGFKSRVSTELYEAAHRAVGEFVGADPTEFTVIFGKNTTEAINKLSYRLNLRKKDIVLISHLEHHSNDLPWRATASVRRIDMAPDGGIDTKHFEALLAKYGQRIKLVAITGASNVTGHIPDIHWFARKAHEHGAQIFVDCAQLAAHRPIRMGQLNEPEHLDYIAISGHKMYAPFGCGALIGRREVFARGQPEYSGGGTVAYVTPQTVDWAVPPDSDEAGSPNVVGAVALMVAVQTLQKIGLDTIAAHEAALTSYALTQLKTIPGLMLYGDSNPARASSRSGVIPFTLKDIPAQLVAAVLGYEWGVGVRSGCFCAHPYVMSLLGMSHADAQHVRYNILHRRRDLVPGMVRVSFGMYNSPADVDVLVEALRAIVNGRYTPYQVDKATGVFSPEREDDFVVSSFLKPIIKVK